MGRYSISNFMALIALVAANLASLRLLTQKNSGSEETGMIVLGLVPLLDATLIGLWSISRRYHIALKRCEDRKSFMFVGACSLFLGIAIVAGFVAPPVVMGYIVIAVDGLLYFLPWLKPLTNGDTVMSRLVIVPILLGLILSGPPILLALVWGVGFGRYRLVITPRE